MKGHLQRLLDRVAPVRPAGADRGYRRLLRWAALPVTDRRWAAPLTAAALGFGLFAGIAIGPGTTGTLATAGPQLIELPPLLSDDGEEEAEAEVETSAESGGIAESDGGEGGEADAFEFEAGSSAYEAPLEAETPATELAPPAKEQAPEDEAMPEEEAETMSGVVVHANPAAGSYTVVETGGLMNAVHAAKLPAPGAVVSVPVRILANGTFAEAGERKQSGTKTQASFSGIVTFVDPDPAAPAYAVSKRGVSLLVRIHPDPAGAPAALPQLGAFASVVAEIEKPVPSATEPPAETAPPTPAPAEPAPTCAPDPAQPPVVPAPAAILWQRQLDADGAPFASSDFAGVVTAICPDEGKLSLSGDDLRQSGKDILFTVPAAIDLGKLQLGDSVAATAAIEAGGGLTLTGLASDERAKGADDAAATQGDLASHEPK